MKRKFLRQDYMRHIKLGKGRKKLLKWRRPTGNHSKMRRKRKGYPLSPSIGYGSPKKNIRKIISPVYINNLNDLANLNKNSVVIISKRIGAKKKIDIIKRASESNLKILNVRQGAKK